MHSCFFMMFVSRPIRSDGVFWCVSAFWTLLHVRAEQLMRKLIWVGELEVIPPIVKLTLRAAIHRHSTCLAYFRFACFNVGRPHVQHIRNPFRCIPLSVLRTWDQLPRQMGRHLFWHMNSPLHRYICTNCSRLNFWNFCKVHACLFAMWSPYSESNANILEKSVLAAFQIPAAPPCVKWNTRQPDTTPAAL